MRYLAIDVSGVSATLGGILGVLILLASAAAVIRSSYAKTQVEALRGDRDDLAARVSFLEHENTRLKSDLQTESDRRVALEAVVTGRDELRAISTLLQAHHTTAQQVQGLVVELNQKIDALVAHRRVAPS